MEHDAARLRALFDEVMQAPAESRATLLAARCGDDAALRRRVEALIVTAEADEPFLSEPTRAKPSLAPTPTFAPGPLSERPGTRIGPYKLLQIIGEGGFGVVFMAEQDQPVRRRVALKVIKLGMDTRQVVARFEQERQALALMDHPNIARVFDAGATDSGRPFFVMEYVKGDPITAFADAHKLSVRERLNLLAQVCAAVQHAHTKGVIHRDIKPRNVLVSMVDGKPFAKVIDFGIAKATGARLTEKTLFTEHHQTIGTPEYMSPEQAEGSPDIDTRTDVYALGVLLYELLTGATPFDAKRLRSAAYAEMQRIIKEEEPPAPSVRLSRSLDTLAATAAARQAEPAKLGPLIRGELDWIVMKSLEKDRARRYETPNQLADDMRRHLSGEPVVAAPPSAAYRLRKFVRKHKSQVVATSLILLTLIAGIASTSLYAVRLRNQEAMTGRSLEATEVALDDVKWNAYAANIALTQNAIAASDWSDARERLPECPEDRRGFEWRFLDGQAQRIVCEFPRMFRAVLSPDGRSLLTISSDGEVQLRDALTCRVSCKAATTGMSFSMPVFNPKGTNFLTFSGDGAWVWDSQCRKVGEIKHDDGSVASVAFSPDGKTLLTWNARQIRGSSFVGGDATKVFVHDTFGQMKGEPMRSDDTVWSADFSPDGTRVVTASADKSARLWDLQGRPVGEPMRHEQAVFSVVFSPDGNRVLTTSQDKTACLWDLQGHRVGDAMRHEEFVFTAVFSPDGALVLTASYDNTARLWDSNGRPVGKPMRHEAGVNFAGFSPDGTRVLTRSQDGTARVWSLQGDPTSVPMPQEADDEPPTFSPDGTRILTWYKGKIRLRDGTTGQPIGEEVKAEDDIVESAAFVPGGMRALLSLGYTGAARKQIVDLSQFGENRGVFPAQPLSPELIVLVGSLPGLDHDHSINRGNVSAQVRGAMDSGATVTATAMTPDGSRLVIARTNQSVSFLHPPSGRELAVFRLPAVANELRFAPDGTRLLLTLDNGTAQLWDGRDVGARNADVAARWEEREHVQSWVDETLSGPAPIAELEGIVARGNARSPIQRLAALDLLREKRRELGCEAQKHQKALQDQYLSKSQVLAAARRLEDVPRRVKEALVERIEEWEQDAPALWRACWTVVRSPKSSGERIAFALEGASQAIAQAPDGPRCNMTLGAAKYRIGDFSGALEALSRSSDLFTKDLKRVPPRCLALLSMTHHRLGHADEARDTLQQLRALLSDAETLKTNGEDGWDDDAKSLLAEAEALIEPKSEEAIVPLPAPPASP